MEFSNVARHLPTLISSEGLQYIINSPRTKILVIMAIYMVSPLDILPEAVLGPLGLADDGLVMINMVRMLGGYLINFVREESRRNI